MKYIKTFSDECEVSQVALGCMRISDKNDKEMDFYLGNAVELGINYFDHADIYGRGKCEEVFGAALKRNPALRDKIYIQTKCSIVPGSMYDFSKGHIISAVDGSLKRLGVDCVDVLLLHRPDLLMEPSEVAEAFDELEAKGKVKAFGVSNHSPLQIELLQREVKQKLSINQMQLSITNANMLASGANVNLPCEDGVNYDGYLRDYCRLKGITIQPWSPLQYGFIAGNFVDNKKYKSLNKVIDELAEKYGLTATGMAIAWLMRLPEKMQPIVGSTNPDRIKAVAQAADVTISREDWYRIYREAGYRLP